MQGCLVLVVRKMNERDHVDVGGRSAFDRLDVFNETPVDPLEALDKADILQSATKLEKSADDFSTRVGITESQHEIGKRNRVR